LLATEPLVPAARAESTTLGAALVALGAICFASKGIFAKHLYAQGVSADVLVTWRAVLSLPVFWLWGLYSARTALRDAPRSAIVSACLVGILCYCIGSLMDFHALNMIDVSVERVLLFSYPAIVVLMASALTCQWPSRSVVLAVVLTYAGILLVVSGLNLDVLQQNATGAILVLLCAVTYALYFIVSEHNMRAMGSTAFTTYSMTAACLALILWYVIRLPISDLALPRAAWADMLAVAAVSTVAGVFLVAEGVRLIGAQRAAVVSTVGPPAAAALAWIFLGEMMHLPQWIGMALIVVGILVLDLSRTNKVIAPSPAGD